LSTQGQRHARRALVMLAVFGALTAAQGPLAGGLSSAGLTPHPDRFTELYFATPNHLPSSAHLGRDVPIDFIIVNHEGKSMTYFWRLLASTKDGRTVQLLADREVVGAGRRGVVRAIARLGDPAATTHLRVRLRGRTEEIAVNLARSRP
jgi:hypothetical protein